MDRALLDAGCRKCFVLFDEDYLIWLDPSGGRLEHATVDAYRQMARCRHLEHCLSVCERGMDGQGLEVGR